MCANAIRKTCRSYRIWFVPRVMLAGLGICARPPARAISEDESAGRKRYNFDRGMADNRRNQRHGEAPRGGRILGAGRTRLIGSSQLILRMPVSIQNAADMAKMRPLMASVNAPSNAEKDAGAYGAFLDAQKEVNKGHQIASCYGYRHESSVR